jgi:hypothetical protein
MSKLFSLLESSVWKHTQEHDSGIITAFRYKNRNAKLKAKLLSKGYGVALINEKEVKEDSFLVVDLKDTGKLEQDLRRLGEEFEQDSIIFQERGGEKGEYSKINGSLFECIDENLKTLTDYYPTEIRSFKLLAES